MMLSAFNRLNAAISLASHSIADFLLPPVCLRCKVPTERHHMLCPQCWADINFITPPVCERLGTPLPFHTDGPVISVAALAYPPAFDRARSVAHFSGPLRDLIHALKYADHHEGQALFGRWLAQAGRDLLQDADFLVPIPLYRLRFWSRRFNQSAILADALARETGLAVKPFLLKRIKPTKAQVGLTLKQRKKNVSGAFGVVPGLAHEIKNKKIVLIDDVMTTGATVEACSKVLRKTGAARVDVLTLGRVIDVTSLGF